MLAAWVRDVTLLSRLCELTSYPGFVRWGRRKGANALRRQIACGYAGLERLGARPQQVVPLGCRRPTPTFRRGSRPARWAFPRQTAFIARCAAVGIRLAGDPVTASADSSVAAEPPAS